MRPRMLLFFAVAAVPLLIPLAAEAAIPFFGPIIDPKFMDSRCALGWGAVMIVINNVISFLITIAIVFVAPLMVAWSGFLFVVNPVHAEGISRARKILTNTVVGIALALAGWLLVDAVMAVLYNPDASSGQTKLGVWSSLVTGSGPTCIDLPGSLSQVTPGVPPPVGVVPGGADEQSIRQRLLAAGVTVNRDPCPTGSNGQGCTNVSGMREATIQQVINIANACGGLRCGIVVSGGTEPGHASGTYSHGAGYKVDLSLNPSVPNVGVLDAYLLSLKSIGTRTGDAPGPAYTDSCGQNQYVREGASATPHWDILVREACGTAPPGTGTGPIVCPAPPENMATAQLAGPGNVLIPMLASGQIVSIPLPAIPSGKRTGMLSIISSPGASTPPEAELQVTISTCPGKIETNPNDFCNLRTTQIEFNTRTWFARAYSEIASAESANARGYCWAPESEGPWYMNARWIYSNCANNAPTCGSGIQWNIGPW